MEFAARQYAPDNLQKFTPELTEAIFLFLDLLEEKRFLEGFYRSECMLESSALQESTRMGALTNR